MRMIAASVVVLALQSFVVPHAAAEMMLWSYKTTARADPPTGSDVIIMAPHLEGDLSGFGEIAIRPIDSQNPSRWTGPFSGSARVPALGFEGGGFPSDIDPFRVGEIHGAYHFTMSLRDEASHAVGALTFAGRFDGLVGNSNMRRVSHTFLSPTTQQAHLGSNLYTVTMNPFQAHPEGLVPAFSDSKIDASVSVSPFVSDTPEPSTLCLAALGLMAACGKGLYGRLRRG